MMEGVPKMMMETLLEGVVDAGIQAFGYLVAEVPACRVLMMMGICS
jgi:hypothetical protein